MSFLAEKIFFFSGSKNRKLLGFLHYADHSKKSIGIVYCHPFAEEKNMRPLQDKPKLRIITF